MKKLTDDDLLKALFRDEDTARRRALDFAPYIEAGLDWQSISELLAHFYPDALFAGRISPDALREAWKSQPERVRDWRASWNEIATEEQFASLFIAEA